MNEETLNCNVQSVDENAWWELIPEIDINEGETFIEQSGTEILSDLNACEWMDKKDESEKDEGFDKFLEQFLDMSKGDREETNKPEGRDAGIDKYAIRSVCQCTACRKRGPLRVVTKEGEKLCLECWKIKGTVWDKWNKVQSWEIRKSRMESYLSRIVELYGKVDEAQDIDVYNPWGKDGRQCVTFFTKIVRLEVNSQILYCAAISIDRGKTILVPKRNSLFWN